MKNDRSQKNIEYKHLQKCYNKLHSSADVLRQTSPTLSITLRLSVTPELRETCETNKKFATLAKSTK